MAAKQTSRKRTAKRTRKAQPAVKRAAAKTKPKTTAAKQPAAKAQQPTAGRCRVLGHNAAGVLRWMGANGYTVEQANKVINALAEGGELKPSSITTYISDGKSGKWGAPAPVTKAEAQQLAKAAR